MGIFELALIVVAALLSGALVVAAFRVLRRSPKSDAPPELPPRSVPLLLASAASLAVAPALGWFVAPLLVETIVAAMPDGVVVMDAAEPVVARVYGAGLIAVWAAAPGVCAIAWSLLSSRRSARAAILFGGITWGGVSSGVAIGLVLVPPTLASLAGAASGLEIGLHGIMSATVRGALGLGCCGGCLASVAFAAAASDRGLRAALLTTVALPFGAMLIAALATPPDPASQLVLAFAIVVCWAFGLGAGALMRIVIRRREKAASGPSAS